MLQGRLCSEAFRGIKGEKFLNEIYSSRGKFEALRVGKRSAWKDWEV